MTTETGLDMLLERYREENKRLRNAFEQLQSMPQRIIACGDVNGAVEWRDGLNEINDVLDKALIWVK